MSTYVYRCVPCRLEIEVQEKFGSAPSLRTCPEYPKHEPMHRVPQLFSAHFKGTGFTRVSTNEEHNRKLPPWMGGKAENAPDYQESVEFKNEQRKVIERGKREGYMPNRELSKMSDDMEKASIDRMEQRLGNNIYNPEVKKEYFRYKEEKRQGVVDAPLGNGN